MMTGPPIESLRSDCEDIYAFPALKRQFRFGLTFRQILKNSTQAFFIENFRDWLAKTFDVSAFNPAFAAVPIVLLVTLGIIVGLMKYKSTENSFSGNVISQKGDTQSSPEKPKTI